MKNTIMLSALVLAGCQTTYEQSYTDFDDIDDLPATEPVEYVVQSFACYGITDTGKEGEVVILSTFVDAPLIGIVTFGDYYNYGIYYTKGIDRNWYYDCDEETDKCDSLITMRPNGVAYFYDFSNSDTATGEYPMMCKYDERFTQEVHEFVIEDGYPESGEFKPLVDHEVPAF